MNATQVAIAEQEPSRTDISPSTPPTRRSDDKEAIVIVENQRETPKRSRFALLKVFGYCEWLDYVLILISILFNVASGVILVS